MPHSALSVTYKSVDPSRLPDALTEAAALLVDLERRGMLSGVGARLHIRRQGGYCGLDVFLILLVFFTTGAHEGLRGFWTKFRTYIRQLAALAGRRSLPSPAALSRALDAVEPDLLRPTSGFLLAELCEVDKVLKHPAMLTRDATGQSWHVFDLDPTVTTLRHRALPTHEELPVARRDSEQTGAPGHAGRKRGDLQFRRATVQHAGSGLWLHAHLSPGNGNGVLDLELALDTVVSTCKRIEHPLSRAVVRMDGEHGHVPFFVACRERGLPFITRLNRPKLYEDPAVLERLRTAVWHFVPDSLSGPRRSAAELGLITVAAGERTRRRDGSRYEPVVLRVVASRFERTGKANHGKTLDGWQVELFAVDLPDDAWPAPEAVSAYFGRAGQENRFAQEDRELGLDRILSYHLPGQELAATIGLMLWNLRVVKGFELERPPERCVVQARHTPVSDTRAHEGWPRDPVLLDSLGALDWPQLLKGHPGWKWDVEHGELRCEEGRTLSLTSVRPIDTAKQRTGIILRRPLGGCRECSAREHCLRSPKNEAARHLELMVPTGVARSLRERLDLIRKKVPARTTTITLSAERSGGFAVHESMFLPARARQEFATCFVGASLQVEVTLPEPPPPRPRLVALDIAERQRRRKTWKQNVDRYALPAGTRVQLVVTGSAALRRLFGEQTESTALAKAG